MPNNKDVTKLLDFQTYLDKQLKNPEFKKHFDKAGKQLEIAYQIIALRKKTGMSQAGLAKKLGTTQSNIARMEAEIKAPDACEKAAMRHLALH